MPARSASSAPPAARASAREFAVLVTPGITAAQALRAVTRRGLEILVGNRRGMLAGSPGIEHVHQARVALRRMRSAVLLYDPQCLDFPPKRLRDIQRLARTLGETRDWDVLVDKTMPAILARIDGKTADTLGLLKRARRMREAAFEQALDAAGSHRFERFAQSLAAWHASPAPPSPRAAEVAPARLDAIADSIAAGALAFPDLSMRARHRVRIEVKRLRYALDLLKVELPARPVDATIEALASLQDTLGELNDAVVAREKLGGAARHGRERRLVEEWYGAVEPRLVGLATAQLRALARRPRPWAQTKKLRAA